MTTTGCTATEQGYGLDGMNGHLCELMNTGQPLGWAVVFAVCALLAGLGFWWVSRRGGKA